MGPSGSRGRSAARARREFAAGGSDEAGGRLHGKGATCAASTDPAPHLTRSHPPIHPGLERAPLRHLLEEAVSDDPEYERPVHQIHREAVRADGTRVHDQQIGPERRGEARRVGVQPPALLLEELNPGDDERVARPRPGGEQGQRVGQDQRVLGARPRRRGHHRVADAMKGVHRGPIAGADRVVTPGGEDPEGKRRERTVSHGYPSSYGETPGGKPRTSRRPEANRAPGLHLAASPLRRTSHSARGMMSKRRAQNCAASVDSCKATVEASPPVMVFITSSKYPVPTSRWWRVAEYPAASEANSASCSSAYAAIPRARKPLASSNIAWFKAWNPAKVTNWNLYPIAASSRWNLAMLRSSRFFRQLNDGEQLYASILPGNPACTPSAKRRASARSGVAVSHQRRSA